MALEAIGGELTVAELVAKSGVHQTLINTWKRQALEGISGIFSGKAEAKVAEKDSEIKNLHAKIGQLVVEQDFLAKASGRRAWPEARNDRPAARGAVDHSAMRADRDQLISVV